MPVINGLTDFSHPCQAVADYMTVFEHKQRLEGLTLAFIGDGNNVANSLLFAGALLGVNVRVGTPKGYEPRPDVMDWANSTPRRTGRTCAVTNDPFEAVRGADVVYTDVWASMGQEAEAASAQRCVPALPGQSRRCSQRRGQTRSSCTACPRTAATRSPTT